MASSMLYTMGMALDRAAENGLSVSLLVDGSWISGRVAANDGVGVVLELAEVGHSVVRTERVSAVKVLADLPHRVPIGPQTDPFSARVHEMPEPMVAN